MARVSHLVVVRAGKEPLLTCLFLEDMSYAHQASLRDGPNGLSELWEPERVCGQTGRSSFAREHPCHFHPPVAPGRLSSSSSIQFLRTGYDDLESHDFRYDRLVCYFLPVD